ncbi:DUF6235 family protein [Saccharothrix hoggarensis]|uniref:DUF6235 family protein n=1 Tax=Saccharothrix hoggarensis TaxID=913853 RepID=A0ABW3R5D0_9PSEU
MAAAPRLQLTSGLDVLEEWAVSACQADRDVVYEVLFSMTDGSVFLVYDMFRVPRQADRYVILVKHDLVVRVAIRWAESSFDIAYVGELSGDDQAVVWWSALDDY